MCTGAGAGSGSTRFRRRFRRFRRRSGRQVRFNRHPEKVPVKVWEALVQRFNRVPEKVPEKVWEALVQVPGQFQRGSKEGSGEGFGGFGAEPGQV